MATPNEENFVAMIHKVLDYTHNLDPVHYPILLVDALAYYLVVAELEPTQAIERLNKSFSSIATAHAVVHHGGSRA